MSRTERMLLYIVLWMLLAFVAIFILIAYVPIKAPQ